MGIMSLSKKEFASALKNGNITICVVGLGRIGFPQTVFFAEVGAMVIGADIDPVVVEQVNTGKNPLPDEPGLDKFFTRVVKHGRLKARVDVSSGVEVADVVIVCVPTPVNAKKNPNYSYVEEACHAIAKTLQEDCLIVIESTVGPGAVENIIVPLLEKETGMKACIDFGVASCPERADPGRVLRDLTTVPRIVGGIDSKSAEIAGTLYKETFGIRVVVVSNPKTANAVKLSENLFRDVNIALANEFALLYGKLGIDVIEVIEGCSTKYNFMPHYPGAGVGGPCLPQNPYFLIHEGKRAGYVPRLVQTAREINDSMPEHVVVTVINELKNINKEVENSKVAILGVTYKPNFHDLQLTPVKEIFAYLENRGANLTIYDPMFRGETVFGAKASRSLEEAVKGVDCILVSTAHDEFRNLDLAILGQMCNLPAVFVDAAHVADRSIAHECGFVYSGLGKR